MYVVKGSCKILNFNKEYVLKEHQYIFLDKGQYHSLIVDNENGCHMLNLEFIWQDTKGLINKNELAKNDSCFCELLNSQIPCFKGDDTTGLGIALKDFIFNLKQPHFREYLQKILFERVLLELAGCYQNELKNNAINYLYIATEYIETHFAEDLSVEQISKYVNINKSYLHGLFHKHYKCGIMAYVNKKRLEYAQFLLSNTKKSVIDIAIEIGFNSRQNFTLAFKKLYDTTPQNFRSFHSHTKTPNTVNMNNELNG